VSRRCWAAPAAGLLGAVALIVTAGCLHSRMPGAQAAPATSPLPSPAGSPWPGASPNGPAPARPSTELTPRAVPVAYPRSGPGTFQYVTTAGPVLGQAGTIRHFRVAVESNLGMIDMTSVASKIDNVLGDSHSWIAGGQVRFQRVPPGAPYEFTIHLATSETTRVMCTAGGVGRTGGYTSCRYSGHVVLNLDRWISSVRYYSGAGLPLDTYRTYMINHEVGHELGYGHELCPGPDRPAPVMQQQTLGLHGCTPNPWPYLNGSRYAGPPGSY
jgi:hypothetical protein